MPVHSGTLPAQTRPGCIGGSEPRFAPSREGALASNRLPETCGADGAGCGPTCGSLDMDLTLRRTARLADECERLMRALSGVPGVSDVPRGWLVASIRACAAVRAACACAAEAHREDAAAHLLRVQWALARVAGRLRQARALVATMSADTTAGTPSRCPSDERGWVPLRPSARGR